MERALEQVRSGRGSVHLSKLLVCQPRLFHLISEGAFARRAPGIQINVPADALPPNIAPPPAQAT